MPRSLFSASAPPLLTRDQAKAISDKVLSFAKADETRVAITGGWYEHRLVTVSQTELRRLVNDEGWQLAGGPEVLGYYLRRPRFRLP